MQTVGLTWQQSFEAATAVGAAGVLLAVPAQRFARALGAAAREVAVIGFLYGLWHLAGQVSITDVPGAHRRAVWIEHADRYLPLPTEHHLQQLVLGHRLIVQGANLYYASMHLTIMLLFLVWLFLRHREQYRPVRQVLAWTTLGCLLIQLLPVAPPRMLPGYVDTGLLYHQSVYSNGLAADQLSALPSVHVAWAVLVGYYAWRVSPSRWRYLGVAHAAVTIFVVVITGNHWWLDGIVAVGVLVGCAWAVHGVRTAWRAWRQARRRPTGAVREPVGQLADVA